MAKGRKQVPEKSKIIRGTFRNDRANPEAPIPDPETPRSPVWLSASAREYFGVLKERLDYMGLLSRTNTEMMALAAERLAEIGYLTRLIEENGPTYISRRYDKEGNVLSEMAKTNPAVSQRSEAMRHLQSLLAEFGLSPASVGKTRVTDGRKKKQTGFGSL